MKQRFKGEDKIRDYDFDRIPKNIIEENFIYDFLQSLPIEYLKRMINYREINYKDENLWK